MLCALLFYACHSQLAAFHAARCSPRRCAPQPRPLACRLAAFGRAKAMLSLLTALTQLSYGRNLCILFYACHSQLAAFHAARCSPRRCAPLPRPLACRLAAFGRAKAMLSLLTALTQLSYGRKLDAFYSTPAIPNWQRFTLLGARLVAALLCPGHSPAGSRRSVGRKQCFRC